MMVNGSLHILRYDPRGDTYNVTYAPYHRSGGSVHGRDFRGEVMLRVFLSGLRIDEDSIEDALETLRRNRQCSLLNVVLACNETVTHGLGPC